MTLRRCIHGRTERQQCAQCNMKIKAERLEAELNSLLRKLELRSDSMGRLPFQMEIQAVKQEIRALNAKMETRE